MSMLTELKAAITKHGSIARTNRFKVDFSGMRAYASDAELRDLEYFLEDVNIPAKDIQTIDYSLYRNQIAYATGYKNGDFSMKFRAPTDMFVKRIFDRWIEKIIPREDYKLSYRKEIVANFTITQTSERTNDHDGFLGIKYYSVKVLDAYPISLSSIDYSNTSEGEYVTFNVDFAFRDVQYFKPNPPKPEFIPEGIVSVGPLEDLTNTTTAIGNKNNPYPTNLPPASTAPVEPISTISGQFPEERPPLDDGAKMPTVKEYTPPKGGTASQRDLEEYFLKINQ